MVIICVTAGSYMRNSGMCRTTGSSQPSFPSSTSRASAAAVNALELDAIAKRECPSTRASRPSSRTPYPVARSGSSGLISATPTPGNGNAARKALTIAVTWASLCIGLAPCAGNAAVSAVAQPASINSRLLVRIMLKPPL
jgi:hypothetical protein